ARAIEDPIPALGPVDGLARFGPEPLRVPRPPRIHLVLGALRGVEARRGAHESVVRESGAEGARTPDLLGAIQALSQLSYSPVGKLNLDTAPLRDNPCKTNTGSPTGRAVEDGGGRWKAVRARRITALHRPPPHIIPMRPISLT